MKEKRILVVDMEPAFIRTARQALGERYRLSIASSRSEGLEKARQEAPDMIIIGFTEPRGESFRLHQELKKNHRTSHTPLLIVDVCPSEHFRKGWREKEGRQMHAEDYISRPVKPAELAELVAEILQKAAPKPVEMDDILEQMEKVLKRIEKIEKLLVS